MGGGGGGRRQGVERTGGERGKGIEKRAAVGYTCLQPAGVSLTFQVASSFSPCSFSPIHYSLYYIVIVLQLP